MKIVQIEGIDVILDLRAGRLEDKEILIPVFFPSPLQGEEDTDVLLGFKNPVAAIRSIVATFLEMKPEEGLILVEAKGKRLSIYRRFLTRLPLSFQDREEDEFFYKALLIS